MGHIAIVEQVEGGRVDWQGKVSDAEYLGEISNETVQPKN
jgi:hypothetical protein